MALNLGGLFFTLDADTRGLINAQRRVEQFAQQVRNAFRGVARGTTTPDIANGFLRQEKAIVSSLERIKRVQASIANAKMSPQGAREAQVVLERLGRSYDNFVRKMTGPVPLNNLDFSRRVMHMRSSIDDATRSLNRLKATAATAPGARPWGNLTNTFRGLGEASLVLQGHWGGMSTRMFALTSLVREFGVVMGAAIGVLAGGATAIGLLGSHAIKTGMAIQRLEQQFTAVSGSTAVAAHNLNFIRDTANRAGVSYIGLAESFARFSAAATSSGLTLGETQEVFNGVSMAAGRMHLSTERVQRTFLALEQMLSKGRVTTEELRRQLGDQLPGAFAIAAKAMGVTQSKLVELLKAGDIVARDFVMKFTRTLLEMWNIDPTKPIETLQADLGRLGNAWTDLGVKITQNYQIMSAAQSAVQKLNEAITWLGNNLNMLIGAVGAAAGALAGFLAVVAAGAVATFVASISGGVVAFFQLAASVRTASQAMALFNLVVAANPIGGIIALLIRLAAVLGGAYIGYNLFTTAISSNTAMQQANMQSIGEYIARSRSMGAQIRSVTMELIRNSTELVRNQRLLVEQGLSQLNASRASGPGLMDHLVAGSSVLLGGTGSVQDVHERRLQGQARALREQVNSLRNMNKHLGTLMNETLQLPEMVGEPLDDISKGANKAGKSVEGITNRIKDLVDAAKVAELQFDAVFKAGTTGELRQTIRELDAYGDALKLVNNLSAKELGVAAGILGVPADVEAVTAAVQDLIQRTKDATDATKEFISVFEGIEQSARKVQNLTRQIEYVNSVGFGQVDPRQMQWIQAVGEAEEQLHKLSQTTRGQQMLGRITQILAEMGYTGGTAAEGLAQLNMQVQTLQDRAKGLEDFSNKMRDIRQEIQGIMDAQAAFGGGGIFGADIGEAFGRAAERGTRVGEDIREMIHKGIFQSQEEVNQATQRYLDLLRNLDEEKEVFSRIQAAAERLRNTMTTMLSDSLNVLKEFLSGTKSLTEALGDLAQKFLDVAWQNFVMAPAQDWMASFGRGKGEAAAQGEDARVANSLIGSLIGLTQQVGNTSTAMGGQLDQSIMGTVTGMITQQSANLTLTGAMANLTFAAQAAALALTNLAASGGGGGAAGGILGAIIKGAGAFMGAGGLGGSGVVSSDSILYGDASINALFPGYATGGNMKAGNVYRVNEPGVMGEYFIPRVNGYMSPRGGSGGSGGGAYVDARTTIDARGSTPDAVAQLAAEMRARDARLRAQLPSLVDARVLDSTSRLRYSG